MIYESETQPEGGPRSCPTRARGKNRADWRGTTVPPSFFLFFRYGIQPGPVGWWRSSGVEIKFKKKTFLGGGNNREAGARKAGEAEGEGEGAVDISYG